MINQYLRFSVLAFVVLFLSACGEEAKQVVHLHGNTMGTTYNVKYVVDDRGQVDGLQEAIDARLVEINKLMSTYDPTSELSRFNQNRYTTPVMECIAAGGPGLKQFERLRDVIKHNLSYLLFARIKEFKAQLSSAQSAVLDIPEIDLAIPMHRDEFETLISEPMAAVANALDTTVAKAGLRHGDIDIVLRTGGSSLIPAVNRLLTDRFNGRVVDHDPFTSVAAGLAIANFRQLKFNA